MLTLGTVQGNALGIYIDDVLIACATSATMDLSTNMADATCKDNDGAEQIKPSQKTWSMALDGMLAFDSNYGWQDLVDAWDQDVLLKVRFGTEELGDEYYEGMAYIDSLSASGPLNEVATYSVNFRGTGTLTIGNNAFIFRSMMNGIVGTTPITAGRLMFDDSEYPAGPFSILGFSKTTVFGEDQSAHILAYQGSVITIYDNNDPLNFLLVDLTVALAVTDEGTYIKATGAAPTAWSVSVPALATELRIEV